MSCTDEDFVTKVIEKSERFFASEMAKLQNQIKIITEKQKQDSVKIQELQAENQQLNEKVQTLENQVANLQQEFQLPKESNQSVMTVMENAFRAGLHSVMAASSELLDITPALMEGLGAPRASSTPSVHITRIPEQGRGNLKRKTPPAEAPRIITSLEQLPEKFRKFIEPYYVTDNQANKDKLNFLQRAFVKAKAKELVGTGASLTTSFVSQIIRQGIDERLWTEDFSPSTELDFQQYLLHRMKNEKKALNRKKMLSTTHDRMQNYLEQALSSINDESEGSRLGLGNNNE